jgi:hypothetical protein
MVGERHGICELALKLGPAGRWMLEATNGVLKVAEVKISERKRRWTGNITGESTGETEIGRKC